MNLLPIRCANPNIIVNPNLPDILRVHHTYVLDGVINYANDSWFSERWYCGELSYPKFPYKYFWDIAHTIDIHRLDRYYIVSGAERVPLFFCVPCGHCALCREKKSLDWQCRCECETAVSTTLPRFVTLTYSDLNLPSQGLKVEHMQDFFRRMRKYFRKRSIDVDIRYFYVGEYGHNTLRPHYHAIIWNFPNYDSQKFQRLMRRFWKKGIVFVGICGQPKRKDGFVEPSLVGDTTGCARYCAKYLRKIQTVPDGKVKPFQRCSNRGGGIGCRWLKQPEIMKFYRDSIEYSKIEVVNPFCGLRSVFSMPQIFRQKLCPTLSRIVPKSYRDAWKIFTRLYCEWYVMIRQSGGRVSDKSEYQDVIDKFSYLPKYSLIDISEYDLTSQKRLNYSYRDSISFFDYFAQVSSELAEVACYLRTFSLSAEEVINLLQYKKRFSQHFKTLPVKEYDVDGLVIQAESIELSYVQKEVL